MIADQTIQQQNAVRLELMEYRRVVSGRDALIRRARAAGLTLAEISRIAGLSRGHVGKIAGEK